MNECVPTPILVISTYCFVLNAKSDKVTSLFLLPLNDVVPRPTGDNLKVFLSTEVT